MADSIPDPQKQSLAPVHYTPQDDASPAGPKEGSALCLSGGGYRAMLFHLGALWRLNEAAYLPRLDRVSSVSGGSIAAGVLALGWPRLAFDPRGVAHGFQEYVVTPLRRLAGQTIDIAAALPNLILPGEASRRIVDAYCKFVFGNATLQDLPDPAQGAPSFVINAANLQSGALWRFSRGYMADYRVGKIKDPTILLATAVAASSAAPPFLSPVMLDFDPFDYEAGSGLDLQYPPYTTHVYLTDGGVYDNLGLETAWKNYKTVLVSDGGGRMKEQPKLARNLLMQMVRVFAVDDNQVRGLRKRQVVGSYLLDEQNPDHRAGAYWGTYSHIADYDLPDALPCPAAKTMKLATVGTRLCRFAPALQEQLINWGYAVCDAALRKHVITDGSLTRPADFPYPRAGVG